jgi:hypothetical protein
MLLLHYPRNYTFASLTNNHTNASLPRWLYWCLSHKVNILMLLSLGAGPVPRKGATQVMQRYLPKARHAHYLEPMCQIFWGLMLVIQSWCVGS